MASNNLPLFNENWFPTHIASDGSQGVYLLVPRKNRIALFSTALFYTKNDRAPQTAAPYEIMDYTKQSNNFVNTDNDIPQDTYILQLKD